MNVGSNPSAKLFEGVKFQQCYYGPEISPENNPHYRNEPRESFEVTGTRTHNERGFVDWEGTSDSKMRVTESRKETSHRVTIEDKDKQKNLHLTLEVDRENDRQLNLVVHNPSDEVHKKGTLSDPRASVVTVPFCELPEQHSLTRQELLIADNVQNMQMIRTDSYTQLAFECANGDLGCLAFEPTGFTPDQQFFADGKAQSFLSKAMGQT